MSPYNDVELVVALAPSVGLGWENIGQISQLLISASRRTRRGRNTSSPIVRALVDSSRFVMSRIRYTPVPR